MKNLRWGLIGFGDAGENFYKNLKLRKISELKNICSKSRFGELKKTFFDIDITVTFLFFFAKKFEIRKKFFSTPPKSTQGINIIILLFIFLLMMIVILP